MSIFGERTIKVIAGLAAGLLAPAASARADDGITAEQLVAPFKAICLDHLGDNAAQAAAAQAAPWNYTPAKHRDGSTDTQRYVSGTIDISIGGADGVCAVTSVMEASVDLAKAGAALRASLPLGPGEASDTGDSLAWKIQTNDAKRDYGIGLMVSTRYGRPLGTLLVQNMGSPE
jgi:hypothetical protein